MARGFIFGIVLTLVVLVGGACAVVWLGLIPANADTQPGTIEQFAAETSLEATLKAQAPKGPNPVALNEANLTAGMTLYSDHCAACHGTAAGEKSASAIAKGEYPPPPQLASEGVEDDPQGWTFWKIKHGIRWTGMPSWGGTLSDQQTWTLALFLKHMDKLPPAVQSAWEKAGNAKQGG
jgi:mono/diheme cytochrome c family protein